MRFADLPTVVRRTYDAYITEYGESNPAAEFRRESDPRQEDAGFVIPFTDTTSGARYEVTITPAGAVVGTQQLV